MAVFCSSLFFCFPLMLLGYSVSDFEMVFVAPVRTGITSDLTFHKHWISIMRTLYFKIFSASFLIIFLSPGIATSINVHVPCILSQIMMSGLLLGIVLSFRTCWFHNISALTSWFVSTDFINWSYQCSFSNFTHISLRIWKRTWAHTLSCFVCIFLLPVLGMLIWCVPLSQQIFLQSLHLLSLSVCKIFVEWFLVCSVWSIAAII